jgi:hypothetical protein
MAIGAVTARIITQYSDKGSKAASRDINKLGKSFDKFAGKVGKAFGVAAVASVAAAGAFAVKAIAAGEAASTANARIDQINKSMGLFGSSTNAVTAQLINYANETARATGLDQNAIKATQAKLLTFKEIARTANEVNGNFQRATKAAIDLGAAGFGTAETNATQLGKALNDPIKGITALTRSGVTFTASEKARIKVLVESNKIGEAQELILAAIEKQVGGTAEATANASDKMKVGFSQLTESIGIALLPAFESLTDLLINKVFPAVQQFVAENQDKIVGIFEKALNAVVAFGFAIFKAFQFVAKNKNLFISLGAIFISTFVAAKVMAFVTAIGALVKAYKAIRTAALAAAAAQAVATGGLSLAAAAAGLAAFTLTMGGLFLTVKKANSEMEKLEGVGEDLDFTFDGLEGATKGFKAELGKMDLNLNKVGKSTKALTDKDLKLIQTQKALAKLRKLGVTPTTETDPIQLEAARLNLVKQGNIQEAERVRTILANLEAQLLTNKAIQRYTDLLAVVADSVISPQEVIVLSQKWGISKEAVVAYTGAIFAVNDGKISKSEVEALASQWGVTKTQAQVYLDFFAALNDGKLSDEEINKLATKWGLTNKQVADYATKISEGVTPSDLWPTPGNQAEKSWKDALKALNDYVAASGAKIAAPTVPAPVPGTPLPPGFTPDPRFLDGITGKKPGDPGFIGPVIPKATPAPTPPSIGRGGGGGGFGAMIAMATGGIVTSPTAALIGEAGPEAVIPLDRMGSMGGSTINIVVNGSVTSEGDLVNSIRNAILQGQNNGQGITKTAIQL